MTFLEAAVAVLAREGRPLHYKAIAERAVKQDFLSHIGSSPDQAMRTRLSVAVRRGPSDSAVIRVGPGVYGLRRWGTSQPLPESPPETESPTVREGQGNATGRGQRLRMDQSGEEETPVHPPSQPKPAGRKAVKADGRKGKRESPPSDSSGPDQSPLPFPEEAAQPAQGHDENTADAAGSESLTPSRSRRRRKRRRRSQTREEAPPAAEKADSVESGEAKSFSGDLLSACSQILASRRKTMSPAELVQGIRSQGRADWLENGAEAFLAAALRSDGGCRKTRNQRPQFIVGANGSVELSDWLLPPEAVRLEQDIRRAAGRLESLAMEAVAQRLKALPLAALIEIVVICLADAGWTGAQVTGRTGEGEALVRCEGSHAGQGARAVVVRRSASENDGLLRRRAAELRGSLHEHSCTAGLIVTTSEVGSDSMAFLSVPGAPVVEVWDQMELARRMARAGIGYDRVRVDIPFVDLNFFDGVTQ